jgi:hypothetical protein
MGVGGQRHARAALSPGKRAGTQCTRGWAGPRAGLDGCGKPRPHRVRAPNRQARSESPHRLHYPGTWAHCNDKMGTVRSDGSVKACLVSSDLFSRMFVEMIVMMMMKSVPNLSKMLLFARARKIRLCRSCCNKTYLKFSPGIRKNLVTESKQNANLLVWSPFSVD